MLDRKLSVCEVEKSPKKWCGIGTNSQFIDTDGNIYPCPYFTPMTVSKQELEEINNMDFESDNDFIDESCYENCYIYPVCPSCFGSCYEKNKAFNIRDKSRCRIQKLITLYSADLLAKKILQDENYIPKEAIFNTISSIKKIRNMYIKEFPFLIRDSHQ